MRLESVPGSTRFGRLSPDSLTIIASYLAVIELHICVTHLTDSTMRARLPRWDDELRRMQAFLRRFGSYTHPLPWHVTTKPNNYQQCQLGRLLLHKSSGCGSFSSVSCHISVVGQTHGPIASTHTCHQCSQDATLQQHAEY